MVSLGILLLPFLRERHLNGHSHHVIAASRMTCGLVVLYLLLVELELVHAAKMTTLGKS